MTFKRWLIILMVLVLVADVAILLDVPVLRQVLGFLCFTIIPGLLILHTLKLNEISLLKRFLLSIGLSISFLIFGGLAINSLTPLFGYSKPLSTLPLVTFFSLALGVLCFVAYWRNKDGIQFTLISGFRESIKNKYLSLLLFPLLFPLLSVIGRNLADTSGNNKVLIAMFLMIPLYIILLMWQNKKIPKATYPVAIGMISIALLLSRGLIGDYLIGGDIYEEYRAFQIVSSNLHWSLAASPDRLTASMSISLLPAIFQSILGINPLYVFKAAFLIPISLIPVIGYVIYERYVGSLYGFLSSFFFMAQIPFIYWLSGMMRIGIALVSFSLALLVLLDNDLPGLAKKLLFLIFLFSLVVEYYVLPVVLLGLMFFFWLIPRVRKGTFGPQSVGFAVGVILPAVLIFFWWGQLTATTFDSYVFFAKEIMVNLSNLFVAELRASDVVTLYTLAPYPSLLMQVPSIIQRISLIIICIGVAFSLTKGQRAKFSNYVVLMVAAFVIVLTVMILPLMAIRYYASRLYIELLVILAPAFILGCQAISNTFIYPFKRIRHTHQAFNLQFIIVGIMIVMLFFSSSSLCNELLDLPGSEILHTKSANYATLHVRDSEIAAAKWLVVNNTENRPVYMNPMVHPSQEIFEYTEYGAKRDFIIYRLWERPAAKDSYVFLRDIDVIDVEADSPYIEPYQYGKIYDNGCCIIYR